MKISELETELARLREEYGDLEILVRDEAGSVSDISEIRESHYGEFLIIEG